MQFQENIQQKHTEQNYVENNAKIGNTCQLRYRTRKCTSFKRPYITVVTMAT